MKNYWCRPLRSVKPLFLKAFFKKKKKRSYVHPTTASHGPQGVHLLSSYPPLPMVLRGSTSSCPIPPPPPHGPQGVHLIPSYPPPSPWSSGVHLLPPPPPILHPPPPPPLMVLRGSTSSHPTPPPPPHGPQGVHLLPSYPHPPPYMLSNLRLEYLIRLVCMLQWVVTMH